MKKYQYCITREYDDNSLREVIRSDEYYLRSKCRRHLGNIYLHDIFHLSNSDSIRNIKCLRVSPDKMLINAETKFQTDDTWVKLRMIYEII